MNLLLCQYQKLQVGKDTGKLVGKAYEFGKGVAKKVIMA